VPLQVSALKQDLYCAIFYVSDYTTLTYLQSRRCVGSANDCPKFGLRRSSTRKTRSLQYCPL